MKLKKILLSTMGAALVAALAIGGTIAYLTSEDSAVNVMTLGNVKIEQFEKERVFDANGDVIGMQDFTPNQALYPAVPINGVSANAAWAPNANVDIYYKDYLGENYPGGNGTWQNLNNVMDKFVFVQNTGESDLYYRTIILVEATDAENSVTNQNMIHMNVNGHSNFTWMNGGDTSDSSIIVEVNGQKYAVECATYNKVLKPNEISRPSLLQVGLDQEATNEIVEGFGDTYEILVLSQAVQAAGFDSAEQALNTSFGAVDATNVKTWFEAIN